MQISYLQRRRIANIVSNGILVFYCSSVSMLFFPNTCLGFSCFFNIIINFEYAIYFNPNEALQFQHNLTVPIDATFWIYSRFFCRSVCTKALRADGNHVPEAKQKQIRRQRPTRRNLHTTHHGKLSCNCTQSAVFNI